MTKAEKNEKRLDALFEELVPMEGKADTVAGEIVRAMCKVGYRYFNDGDYINRGYGKETCNPAARYLKANAGKEVQDLIEMLWNSSCSDKLYEKMLNELIEAVIDYIDQNPELKTTVNEDDMWKYRTREDVDDSYLWEDEWC